MFRSRKIIRVIAFVLAIYLAFATGCTSATSKAAENDPTLPTISEQLLALVEVIETIPDTIAGENNDVNIDVEDMVIESMPVEDADIVDNDAANDVVDNVKKETIDEVPRYSQLDYPHVPYDDGRTVASAGCGITCMAMVATYMLDKVHLPDELALEYDAPGIGNRNRMQNASIGLGLEYDYSYDWNYLIDRLKEGKIAIVLFGHRSIFTESFSGHFVVFTGLTEDGRVMVNDPNGANWNKYQNEFENGFEIDRAYRGFNAAWIYDKDAYVAAMEGQAADADYERPVDVPDEFGNFG